MDFNLPANQYPDDAGIIELVGTFFSGIWDGLARCPVPGFSFSFADLFIALLTAGFIGLILKTAFHYFGSHFSDGSIKHRRPKKDE